MSEAVSERVQLKAETAAGRQSGEYDRQNTPTPGHALHTKNGPTRLQPRISPITYPPASSLASLRSKLLRRCSCSLTAAGDGPSGYDSFRHNGSSARTPGTLAKGLPEGRVAPAALIFLTSSQQFCTCPYHPV